MKFKKLFRTLIGVMVFLLMNQLLLAILVLTLIGDPNSYLGTVAVFIMIASMTVLAFFLSKLFKIFTGKNFGEIDYSTLYPVSKSDNLVENGTSSNSSIKKE